MPLMIWQRLVERLRAAPRTVLKSMPKRRVLELEPAGADAEVEAAAADVVERRRHLRGDGTGGGRCCRSRACRCARASSPAPAPRASSSPRGTAPRDRRRSDRSGRSSRASRSPSRRPSARGRASRPTRCSAGRSGCRSGSDASSCPELSAALRHESTRRHVPLGRLTGAPLSAGDRPPRGRRPGTPQAATSLRAGAPCRRNTVPAAHSAGCGSRCSGRAD